MRMRHCLYMYLAIIIMAVPSRASQYEDSSEDTDKQKQSQTSAASSSAATQSSPSGATTSAPATGASQSAGSSTGSAPSSGTPTAANAQAAGSSNSAGSPAPSVSPEQQAEQAKKETIKQEEKKAAEQAASQEAAKAETLKQEKEKEEAEAQKKAEAAQKEAAEKQEAAKKAEVDAAAKQAQEESVKKEVEEQKRKEEQPAAPAAAQPKPAQQKPAVTKPMPVSAPLKVPAFVQPSTASMPSAEEEGDIINIDTVDLSEPKGNWLLKRQWWERAERTYEKIKQQVERIFESRMVFYNQRSDLDRNVFAAFYQQAGIGEGELQAIVSDLTAQIERSKEIKPGETAQEQSQEQSFMQKITKEKDNLDKLQHDIDLVVEYDHSLNDALIKLREQIGLARRYEQEAWNNLKSIARELSDKKAYELYYTMKGISRNIAAIDNWISKDFQSYFVQLVSRVKDQVAKVKNALQDLKNKGIDLRTEADKLESERIAAEKESCARIQEHEEPEQEQGLLSKIGSYVAVPFIAIWNGIHSIGSFIGSLFSGVYTGVRGLGSSGEAEE